jgi:hypothetical protein
MKNRIPIYVILAITSLFFAGEAKGQCASNMGFENGNFGSWSTVTDSLFINTPANFISRPGRNMAVVNYGVTDLWLGTINRPNLSVGNRLIRVGNRGVRAVSDTVYRKYIIDSLSDKLTIYSIGVSELAHNYWGVPVNESPGFGYEIAINGKKIDCLKGAFFTGNLDQPPVWQLGAFRDTANRVRKSTGWGEETLNFACFVGDTVEIRLFTRDCILLGHYAYAYFDVVCGDTSKPVLSQIEVNDIIAADELNLYCTPSATLYLAPQTDICPIFMGNIQWSPPNKIVGPRTADSAIINVSDSAWIYVEAEFSNYCMTVKIIDSIFVRKLNSDPHDNLPKVDRNFCDCKADTTDFTGIPVTSIVGSNGTAYTLDANNLLIVNPCDEFYHEAFWKLPSTNISINGSTIGATSWSSGNNRGAQGVDTITPGGSIKYEVTTQAGKLFYAGLTRTNASFNNDMTHSVYFNGTTLTAYFGTTSVQGLGTYTGPTTVEFKVASNRRVSIWINGVSVYTYSNSRLANSNVFPDYSGQSNNNPHIDKAYVYGPTKNEKSFNKLVNPAPVSYYLDFVDRCGIATKDTIRITNGFTAALGANMVQCKLDPLRINFTSSNPIDNISWYSPNATGTFSSPTNGAPASPAVLAYAPNANDYNFKPLQVIVTAASGRCRAKDTANITINETPIADAGPDISTTLDSFVIGGSPTGQCLSCGSVSKTWTQGNALSDSTTDNPFAYRNRIGAPYFIVQTIDPTTGCLDFDTVEVYTSLAVGPDFIQSNCLSSKEVDLKWIMLPDINIKQFGIDYSLDGGRNWINMAKIDANQIMSANPSNYNYRLARHAQSEAIYRWYTIDHAGEKQKMLMLNDFECDLGAKYTLYPNPFNENINIEIQSNSGVRSSYQIQIMNQYGQVITDRTINLEEVSTEAKLQVEDLSNLSSGIYYLNVISNSKILYKTILIKTE